jgi:uncharacterized protein with PIN domain
MGRIQHLYQNRFRILAEKLTQPPDGFSEKLFFQAAAFSETKKIHGDFALALVHADVRRAAGETKKFPRKFTCDAGLGGLARWIRAAGYESIWKSESDDAELIREAERMNSTLITTDTMMMERGVLRDGSLPAVCLPSSLKCSEQLAVLVGELGLKQCEPRCMACGGELCRVPKETVAERIPPRTALWLNDYFVCAQCHQLFWHGTHWKKIAAQLEKLDFLSAGTREAFR